jgi:hypothetical protein
VSIWKAIEQAEDPHWILRDGRMHMKGTRMKKQRDVEQDPDMLDDYDFSNGVRGKYVERFAQGSNVVVLSPDVAEVFPDSESVNTALRFLLEVADRSSGKVSTP